MAEFEIVVPGRLCILGEHSDWAATYASQNSEVPEGFAVVCSTNEALYCKCKKFVAENSEKYLEFQRIGDFVDKLPPDSCKIALDFDTLKDFASNGNFFAYVAGSTAALLGHLRKKGTEDLIDGSILIQNYKSTFPLKKGLSSSAAICVSVVKCFNAVFNLNLTLEEIMDIAYQGENRFTSSQCGRMDQCVAMGPNSSAVMKFRGDSCEMTVLKCGRQLHFVFADLKSSKDTIVILRELNACFPFPQNESQAYMLRYVKENVDISRRAAKAIEEGNVNELASCMLQSQENFDRAGFANCPSELTSPKLHSLFEDEVILRSSLARKGVGSQGDGCIQVLCDSESSQSIVFDRLQELGCEPYRLTLNP